MSAVAAPVRAPSVMERPQPDERCSARGDDVRLEDVILGCWEDVVAEGRCACPVCGGSMARGGHEATCTVCGTALS